MAGKIELNLKQFKHVKSDTKSTTLQHQQGHMLTLAHNALSPEAREQLKQLAKSAQTTQDTNEAQAEAPRKMADGGDVDEYGYPKKSTTPKADPTPAPKNEFKDNGTGVQDTSGYDKKAKGGVVKMYADPDEAVSADDSAPVGIPTKLPTKLPPALLDANNSVVDTNINDLEAQAAADNTPTAEYQRRMQAADAPRQANNKMLAALGLNGDSIDKAGPSKASVLAELANEKFDKDQAPNQKLQNEQLEQDLATKAGVVLPGSQTPDVQPQSAEVAKPSDNALVPQSTNPNAPPAQQAGLPSMDALAGTFYNKGMAATSALQKTQEALGASEQAAQEQHAQDIAATQSHFQDAAQSLEDERQAHLKDIANGYVDPNKYWTGYTAANGDKVEGHSKVAAGIGMILAGFNPTSNPNAAISMLKNQMDMSMQAQSKNLDSNHNLLRANLDQFKNIRDAADMTRLQLNDALQAQLGIAAGKAKNQGAAGAAMAAQSALAKDAIPIAQNLQMRHALQTMSQGGLPPAAQEAAMNQMMYLNPEVYKEMAPKFLAGVGFAATPLTPEVRSQITATNQFEQAAQEYKAFAKANAGTVLNQATVAQGKAMAANLQNLYRQSIHGGVFKQGEQSFIQNIIPSDPTQFGGSIRTIPKIDELMHENRNALGTVYQGLGGDFARKASQDNQARVNQNQQAILNWARDPRNAKDPRAAQVLKKLGQ